MSTVFSTRFLLSTGSTGATYTVPSGKVAVLRSVTAVNRDGSSQWFLVSINPAGAYVVFGQLEANDATVGRASSIRELRLVVNAGEQMRVSTSSANMDVTLSGYLLTLP